MVSCGCNQDDGSLSQKVHYFISVISFRTLFPFTASLTSTVAILENPPSTQLYKPPRVELPEPSVSTILRQVMS